MPETSLPTLEPRLLRLLNDAAYHINYAADSMFRKKLKQTDECLTDVEKEINRARDTLAELEKQGPPVPSDD